MEPLVSALSWQINQCSCCFYNKNLYFVCLFLLFPYIIVGSEGLHQVRATGYPNLLSTFSPSLVAIQLAIHCTHVKSATVTLVTVAQENCMQMFWCDLDEILNPKQRRKGSSTWLTVLPRRTYMDSTCIMVNLVIHYVWGTGGYSQMHEIIYLRISLWIWFVNGDFTIETHDVTISILSEVCHSVASEPPLQTLNCETSIYRSANTESEACLDVRAHGFWNLVQDMYFDTSVFYPNTPSYHKSFLRNIKSMSRQRKESTASMCKKSSMVYSLPWYFPLQGYGKGMWSARFFFNGWQIQEARQATLHHYGLFEMSQFFPAAIYYLMHLWI